MNRLTQAIKALVQTTPFLIAAVLMWTLSPNGV